MVFYAHDHDPHAYSDDTCTYVPVVSYKNINITNIEENVIVVDVVIFPMPNSVDTTCYFIYVLAPAPGAYSTRNNININIIALRAIDIYRYRI